MYARKVVFSGNTWQNLASDYFAEVHPGGKNEESAKNGTHYVYEFSGNIIKKFSENSLHPDWAAYQSVTSEVIVKNNTIPCSCNLPHEGPKGNLRDAWWDTYFTELFFTDTNHCEGARDCSLQQILPILHRKSCLEFVSARSVCGGLLETHKTTELPFEEDVSRDDATVAVVLSSISLVLAVVGLALLYFKMRKIMDPLSVRYSAENNLL